MEQAGGEAVMREAIREADRAIDQVKAEHEATMARRLQAARQQQMLAERVEELTDKANFALGEGRDDLAEAALTRQIDFEAQAASLDQVQAQAREEEPQLEDGLAALQARKRQMEDSLAASSPRAARPRSAATVAAARPIGRQESHGAEQAFDRAMAGSGGVGFTRADADINRSPRSTAAEERHRRRTAGRAEGAAPPDDPQARESCSAGERGDRHDAQGGRGRAVRRPGGRTQRARLVCFAFAGIWGFAALAAGAAGSLPTFVGVGIMALGAGWGGMRAFRKAAHRSRPARRIRHRT